MDKTEKYTTLLAESLAESASMKTTPAASDSELGAGGGDDDEYQPDQVNLDSSIIPHNPYQAPLNRTVKRFRVISM